MPSSASAPASPPSASHSQNSATQPSPGKHLVRFHLSFFFSISRCFSGSCVDSCWLSMTSKADAATNNDGLFNAEEKKPDLSDQFEYGLLLFFLSVFDLKFPVLLKLKSLYCFNIPTVQLQFLSLCDLLNGFPFDLFEYLIGEI